AKRCAKLIAFQVVLGSPIFIGEKIGGIENSVAQKFEGRTVKLIGAALGYDVDLPTGPATEFCLRNAGLDGKLLHGVGDAEIIERRIDLRVLIADAVHQEDIRLRTRSGHVESTALCAGCRRQHAWSKQREIEELTRIERHICNRAAVNNAAQGALIGL